MAKTAWPQHLSPPKASCPASVDEDTEELPDDLQGLSSSRSMKEILGHVVRATSSHGFFHCWQYRGTLYGFFWLMVTVISFIVLLINSSILLQDFKKREIKSWMTLKRHTDGNGLQLPSLVLCNKDLFSSRKIDELKVPVNISNYLMAIASSPFILSRKLQGRTRKSLQFLQEADAQLQEILRERNMTLSQLIDALSLSFTKKVKTVLGLCYVTYVSDEVRQVSTGDYMGFTYYLNDVSDHEPEIMSSIIEKSLMVNSGLQVTLISDVTLPSYLVGRHGAIINPGTLTTMELDLTMMDKYGVKTLVDREEVACIPSSKLHNLEWRSLIHTSVNCELANYRDCIQVLCPNCSLYAHQDFDDTDKPICSVQETALCFSELFKLIKVKEEVLNNTESCWALSKSRCVRVCEELIFFHTNTVNQIPPGIMQPLTEELNVANTTKVSVVAIFYPKLQYRFIRFYRETLMLALGNFGSFMGVMIGSSLITILEVFIFFCLALCAVWDKLRPRLVSCLVGLKKLGRLNPAQPHH